MEKLVLTAQPSTMSSSESDIEIKSALPKKIVKKVPRSPSDDLKNNNKKISTKMMIIDALKELKTRKGVSLYAIKKYLTEKYNVNTEKVNYLIKKSIKSGVEDGTFIQMKGIGASGSFKLAIIKEKPKTKKKPVKTEKTKNIAKKMDKMEKPKEIKLKTSSPKSKKTEKGVQKKLKKKVQVDKTEKESKKIVKENEEKKTKKSKVKMAKGIQTPSKKRAAMMKRKSIGSIIKPPKMKPKSQA